MKTLVETRHEAEQAAMAIRGNLARASAPLSVGVLEQRNGDGAVFSAGTIHRAILNLLEDGEVEFTDDRRLRLTTAASVSL